MDNPVHQSIKQFAELVISLPDADLEREWAWGSYNSEGIRFAFFRNHEDLRSLAVKIAHHRQATGNPPADAQRILAQYHAAYMDLQAVLLGIDRHFFDIHPGEDEWTIRRVYAHIVGAEMGFFVAIKFALEKTRAGEDPLVDIDDDTWLEIIGMEEEEIDAVMAEPLPELQSFHANLHQRILADFSTITDQEIEMLSKFWEAEAYTLRFRLHRFDAHIRQHTIQIEKAMHALGCFPGESQQLLRLVYASLAEVEGALIGLGDDEPGLMGETTMRIDERTSEIETALAG
jgi:hypothetical protein